MHYQAMPSVIGHIKPCKQQASQSRKWGEGSSCLSPKSALHPSSVVIISGHINLQHVSTAL